MNSPDSKSPGQPHHNHPAQAYPKKAVILAANCVAKHNREILMGVATKVGRMTVLIYFN